MPLLNHGLTAAAALWGSSPYAFLYCLVAVRLQLLFHLDLEMELVLFQKWQLDNENRPGGFIILNPNVAIVVGDDR